MATYHKRSDAVADDKALKVKEAIRDVNTASSKRGERITDSDVAEVGDSVTAKATSISLGTGFYSD